MKILMINVVCGIRSTGRICTDLATALDAQGHEVRIAYGREDVPKKYQGYALKVGTELDTKIHALKARLFDYSGFGSKTATERFIKWVMEYNPDVIHIHNIHGYYINIKVLFDYLRTCGKKIIWTLHDCWAFTGHAAYCEAADCERWKNGCYKCPKRFDYPASLTDYSLRNWKKKKLIFQNIPNLRIITPSNWLAGLVKKSFLNKYQVEVIHNGIDTTVFRPIKSDIKRKLGIDEKKIILGVSALWEPRKGLNDFIELSKILPASHIIILVGLSKKQIQNLPNDIIGIERTNSVNELVELYSVADFYLNLTYEDNYPTTNLEAIACGTPVISYDTGGSGESAIINGYVIKKGDFDSILSLINGTKTYNEYNNVDSINKDIFISNYLRVYVGE